MVIMWKTVGEKWWAVFAVLWVDMSVASVASVDSVQVVSTDEQLDMRVVVSTLHGHHSHMLPTASPLSDCSLTVSALSPRLPAGNTATEGTMPSNQLLNLTLQNTGVNTDQKLKTHSIGN